jgi:broad specificity phosphatase PhoE
MMIHLVRHGQTPWNRDGLFRGRHDVPLSDAGKRQAVAVAEFLGGRPVRHLYTSPLSRSAQTASIIAEKVGCPVREHEGLIDVDFGQWEGKTAGEVSSIFARSYTRYKNQPERAAFPGGESLNGCFERAVRALHQITVEVEAGKAGEDEARRDDTVIVSHRVILKLMILGILGLSTAQFWRIQLDTCSITEVIYEKGCFILHNLNGTCHLGEAGGHGADF